MSVIAAALKHMMAAGMSPEDMLEAVAEMEAALPKSGVRSAAAIRQERYRNRNKPSQSVTSDGEASQGVTPDPSLDDKKTQTHKNTNPTKEKDPKGSQKKGCRLPSDWQPTEELIAHAAEKGCKGDWFWREVEKFKNYWAARPGEKGTKLDWPATFRNWIIAAVERGPPGSGRQPPDDSKSVHAAARKLNLFRRPNGADHEPEPDDTPLLRLVCR